MMVHLAGIWLLSPQRCFTFKLLHKEMLPDPVARALSVRPLGGGFDSRSGHVCLSLASLCCLV